jgi:hypothetical protein
VSVIAIVTAACAAREPAAPTQLANRGAAGPAEVAWRASSARSGDDREQITITFVLRGRVVAHDALCCSVAVADQCHAHAAGSDAFYIACAEELTRWEAKLVSGEIVVTRVDTFIESAQRERHRELARIPTAAKSLVLTEQE